MSRRNQTAGQSQGRQFGQHFRVSLPILKPPRDSLPFSLWEMLDNGAHPAGQLSHGNGLL